MHILSTSTAMDASIAQSLAKLCCPGQATVRASQPKMRKMLSALSKTLAVAMHAWLDEMLAAPVTIKDDGVIREVELLEAFRYGYSRDARTILGAQLMPDLSWIHADRGINFLPLLPRRHWRRRVRDALRKRVYNHLLGAVTPWLPNADEAARTALRTLAVDMADRAWKRAALWPVLNQRLKAEALRPLVYDALALEPALLDLAWASRLCPAAHWVDNHWLSFVWQHRYMLARVRAQTPNLLPLVAEHAYQHRDAEGDATAAALDYLKRYGVKKQGYLLLSQHSVEVFREVLADWDASVALPMLALLLQLAQDDNGAQLPSPAVYRMLLSPQAENFTLDYFKIRYDTMPRRMLRTIRTHLETIRGAARQHQAACEVAHILRWINAPAGACQAHAHAGYRRLLKLVSDAEKRRQAAMLADTWNSPIDEYTSGTTKAVAVNNALALFDEGRRMKHCINTYLDRCKQGEFLVFHATCGDATRGDQQEATIGLRKVADKWALADVRGFHNARNVEPFESLTRKLVQACNDASIQTTFAKLRAAKALAVALKTGQERERRYIEVLAARRRCVETDNAQLANPIAKFRLWYGKAHAITTALALYDEGREMRNDAYVFNAACRNGEVLAFHVEFNRYRGQLRERGTVFIGKGSTGWEVRDVMMYLNLRVSEHHYAWAFARRLATACNDKTAGMPPNGALPQAA